MQLPGPYCQQVRTLCRRVHKWITRQPAVGEESITDWLLFEVSDQLPSVRYIKFTRFEEARLTGADWDWWFVAKHLSMGWRLQAKKLVTGTDHYGDLARANRFGLQAEKLLDSARSDNLLAFYSLYHAPSGSPVVSCKGFAGAGAEEGVFLTAARSVYDTFIRPGRQKVDADPLIALSNPLSCLFCCPLSGGPSPLPVERLYEYVREYHRGAIQTEAGQESQQPGLHTRLPRHVAAVLEFPDGEVPNWYEPEFRLATQHTGALLIFDLRG